MLSTYLRPCLVASGRLARGPVAVPRRRMSDMIPPDQYDVPFPKRLTLTYAMVVHWEIIPVIAVTAFAMGLCTAAIFWAIGHKMDVTFSTHNYRPLERTMDLNKPEAHKMIIINQRYDPWPEMQLVLDKITLAEKRDKGRKQNCQPT